MTRPAHETALEAVTTVLAWLVEDVADGTLHPATPGGLLAATNGRARDACGTYGLPLQPWLPHVRGGVRHAIATATDPRLAGAHPAAIDIAVARTGDLAPGPLARTLTSALRAVESPPPDQISWRHAIALALAADVILHD